MNFDGIPLFKRGERGRPYVRGFVVPGTGHQVFMTDAGLMFSTAHAAYENHARWLVNLGDFHRGRHRGFRQERVARLTRLLKMWDQRRS